MFALFIFFVIAAGIPDWRALQYGIANSYGFGIYGEAGKAVFIGIITFALLVRRSRAKYTLQPWRLRGLTWLIGVIALEIIGWFAIGKFAADRSSIGWLFVAHVCLIVISMLMLFFAFGVRNLYLALVRVYRDEVLKSLGLSVIFELFLLGLYMLWPYMSSIILFCVKSLFNDIGIHAVFVPAYTLIFSKFSISVGEYCSGIDSAALFTALYGLIGVLDWQRLNHMRFLLVFAPAIALMFGLNIVRIFLLILAGYYINPRIAFSLFHTYAGMAFFFIFSAVFFSVSYKWMLKDNLTRTLQ